MYIENYQSRHIIILGNPGRNCPNSWGMERGEEREGNQASDKKKKKDRELILTFFSVVDHDTKWRSQIYIKRLG